MGRLFIICSALLIIGCGQPKNEDVTTVPSDCNAVVVDGYKYFNCYKSESDKTDAVPDKCSTHYQTAMHSFYGESGEVMAEAYSCTPVKNCYYLVHYSTGAGDLFREETICVL